MTYFCIFEYSYCLLISQEPRKIPSIEVSESTEINEKSVYRNVINKSIQTVQ